MASLMFCRGASFAKDVGNNVDDEVESQVFGGKNFIIKIIKLPSSVNGIVMIIIHISAHTHTQMLKCSKMEFPQPS